MSRRDELDGCSVRAWHGSFELKATVLEQIDRHYAVARFAPLDVGGRKVALYGWPESVDIQGLQAALGLPLDFLTVALDAFDDFPETHKGVLRVIAEKRQLLDAVPLGADLSGIAHELAERQLIDATTLTSLASHGEVKAAVLDLLREATVR